MWETSQKDQRPSDLTICWYILCMWVLARRDLEVFDSMLVFFFFCIPQLKEGGFGTFFGPVWLFQAFPLMRALGVVVPLAPTSSPSGSTSTGPPVKCCWTAVLRTAASAPHSAWSCSGKRPCVTNRPRGRRLSPLCPLLPNVGLSTWQQGCLHNLRGLRE